MPSKNITFDPDAGVPKGANFTLHTGADFDATFNVVNTSNSAYDFTGYSGSSQLSRSVAVGATLGVTTTFTVGFTSAYDGKVKISLEGSQTRNLSEGRYVYDLLVTGDSVTKDILDTSISVGSTAGIGTTSFSLNKTTNVAVGDSVSVGAAITNVPVVSVATTTNTITIGTGNTSPLEILPGTAVTFTRIGTASTIYSLVNGNILVVAGISSAP